MRLLIIGIINVLLFVRSRLMVSKGLFGSNVGRKKESGAGAVSLKAPC